MNIEMWLRNVSLKSKQQQWKYIYVVIIKTGHNEWYELLLLLIVDVYFVTNDVYVKCHYNEKLLKYFISKQWKGSMKWLILHKKNLYMSQHVCSIKICMRK